MTATTPLLALLPLTTPSSTTTPTEMTTMTTQSEPDEQRPTQLPHLSEHPGSMPTCGNAKASDMLLSWTSECGKSRPVCPCAQLAQGIPQATGVPLAGKGLDPAEESQTHPRGSLRLRSMKLCPSWAWGNSEEFAPRGGCWICWSQCGWLPR